MTVGCACRQIATWPIERVEMRAAINRSEIGDRFSAAVAHLASRSDTASQKEVARRLQ